MPDAHAEIAALIADDSIDVTLGEYMDLITAWALRAKQRHSLSDEALVVLLKTAPPADIAFVAGIGHHLKHHNH
jgi:hypothetical protein